MDTGTGNSTTFSTLDKIATSTSRWLGPSFTLSLKWTLKFILVVEAVGTVYTILSGHIRDVLIAWLALFLSAGLFLLLDSELELYEIYLGAAEFATIMMALGIGAISVLRFINKFIAHPASFSFGILALACLGGALKELWGMGEGLAFLKGSDATGEPQLEVITPTDQDRWNWTKILY